jgi:hypothetical protein
LITLTRSREVDDMDDAFPLDQRRDARRRKNSPTSGPHVPGDPRLIERAKGALMLRLGCSSPEALALLLHWAHSADSDLRQISEVLVLGLMEGDDQVKDRHPLLTRWLQGRLQAVADG